MTVASGSNNSLPTAYEGQNQNGQDGFLASPAADGRSRNGVNSELLDFLQANTQDVTYLFAVPSSQQGASYVIETGRSVLYMGGFSGQDQVVGADDLAEMVANGELRYILYGGDKEDIVTWLNSSCTVVDGFTLNQNGPQGQGGSQQMKLYECK